MVEFKLFIDHDVGKSPLVAFSYGDVDLINRAAPCGGSRGSLMIGMPCDIGLTSIYGNGSGRPILLGGIRGFNRGNLCHELKAFGFRSTGWVIHSDTSCLRCYIKRLEQYSVLLFRHIRIAGEIFVRASPKHQCG